MWELPIKLFNIVEVPRGSSLLDKQSVTGLNLEAAFFGYTLAPDLLDAVMRLNKTEFLKFRDDFLKTLKKIKGSGKNYQFLFRGFPYSTPNERDYLDQRIIGDISNKLGITLGGNTLTVLSCGHTIDSALFDINDFGACPICQHAVPELEFQDTARHPFQSVTPLTILDLARGGMVKQGDVLLARQSSLSGDEKDFLNLLISRGVKLSLPETAYRENIPFLYRAFGAEKIKGLLTGVTDVLRIAVFLSDEHADLSLKDSVKFRLKTSDKRAFMNLIEGRGNIAEDMMRHRERWLRLGFLLSPGSAKNREKFPKTAQAFDQLRNDQKSIPTFNRQMEYAVRHSSVDQQVVDLITERPGEYLRRFDALLSRAQDPQLVLNGLRKIVSRTNERLLLDMRKYLGSRNGLRQRVFFPKGRVNRAQVVPDNRPPIDPSVINEAIGIIDTDLARRYAEKEAMGRVFIDPLLRGILMPFNRRGDSSTSSAFVKGSRYPLSPETKFVRLFAWWHNREAGRVDVDASAVFLDETFTNTTYVNFHNYSGQTGAMHSGDIQDAPNGAVEFIDLDLDVIAKNSNGKRYIALSVLSYTGQSFDSFECFAGLMERDGLKSGMAFEPESVRLRIDLKTGKQTIPLMIDLKERVLIFTDLVTGNAAMRSVASEQPKQMALMQAMLSLPDRKATLYDLVSLNAMARGEIVSDRDKADRVFDLIDAPVLIEEGV